MRSRGILGLVWGASFVASLTATTNFSAAANCALYVRAETGVALYGAAGEWWNQAEGRYARGQVPAVGAILVFKRTGHIRSGHVALVTKIVSPHEILIDHANWHHGTVSRGMSVIDTSPSHDWTQVAVMEVRAGKHGRDNPTFGFVYSGMGPREIIETRGSRPLDADLGDPDLAAASLVQGGLAHLAVATEYLDGSIETYRRVRTTHRVHAVSAAQTRRGRAQLSPD